MRRKHLFVALLLAAVLCLCCALALAETYPFTTTTNAKVNMRRSASSSSVVLERLDSGENITVTGEKGNYYQVIARERTGYVLKTYINASSSSTVATVAPIDTNTATGYPYTTTTNNSVNMRAKASSTATILTRIPSGATITVESVGTNYAKVQYNGYSGYCMNDYLNLKTIVGVNATATPVVTTETGATGYQVLQTGSSGSAVKALQSALVELGYLSSTVDGVFGASTYQAVVAFQTKNSYPATGIVDANLQAFLYNGTPLNSAGKATSVKTLAPLDDAIVRIGNMGELVERIQTRLTELGYYTGDVTGTYDTKTSNATKAFQRKHGLTADGKVGEKTKTILFSGNALSATATATPAPTAMPTPTVAPTYTVPTSTVSRGSTGNDAKLVQQRLKDLGYYTGSVDGKFGSASVTALKAFQTANGLDADGKAGTSTYAILFSNNAVDAKTTAAPEVTATPVVTVAPVATATATVTYAPITKETVVTIRLGTSGDAVTRLQLRLVALGYYTVTADGICKQADVNAIKAFQKKNGLDVDGVAGYETQKKLYSFSAIAASGAIAGGTVDGFTTLRIGSRGDAVAQLQQRLIDLGYLTGNADGIFGTDTSNAVIAFQRMNNLSRDGVAGANTQSLLYSATAATPTPVPTATPTAKPTATPAPTSTKVTSVKQGDSNSAVKELQERLIALGYLSGRADGIFGVQTYQAVVAFQRANGLTADGIAGAKTISKLSSSNVVAVATTKPASATATPAATSTVTANNVRASMVKYLNWYTTSRAMARSYPYATIYDYSTGISWQVHMFSFGAHADAEPLTAADTAAMEKSLGGQTWTPRAVWVILGDGTVLMASTHSMPHGTQHISSNNFAGHLCIHFPRTAAQVAAIGSYATSHQSAIDAGWIATQSMK